MAIDPATAKVIVKAAVKVATDPEARKKFLCILLGGIVALLLVILVPVYLLTHPLEILEAAFAGSPDSEGIIVIEQFKQENDDAVLTFGSDVLWYEGA